MNNYRKQQISHLSVVCKSVIIIARILFRAVHYSVVPHSGLPVKGGASTSRVARGIKGKGPRLTFEPLRLLPEFRRKQKMSELNIYTTRTLETHIYTIADRVTLL